MCYLWRPKFVIVFTHVIDPFRISPAGVLGVEFIRHISEIYGGVYLYHRLMLMMVFVHCFALCLISDVFLDKYKCHLKYPVCFRMQNTSTHDQIETCGFVMLNAYVHSAIPGNKRRNVKALIHL